MTVAVIGPFPPPYHGAGKNTARIALLIEENGGNVYKLNTNPIGAVSYRRNIVFHLRKLNRTVLNIFSLYRCRAMYIVPDGGKGIYYTALYCIVAKLFNINTFIHHRNYSHIYKYSMTMSFLLSILPAAENIFLTQKMADDYQKLYGKLRNLCVVSNAAMSDVGGITIPTERGKFISIGYLSNLTEEKGFFEVLDVFSQLSEDKRFTFHIAGEPSNTMEQKFLEKSIINLGPKLLYWGAIYGNTKNDFFKSIDIFIFPTKYRLEAQPNVIIEALQAGCYVIATDRACIADTLADFPSSCIAEDDKIVENTIISCTNIAYLFEDNELKRKISDESNKSVVLAQAELSHLIDRILKKSTKEL